VEGRNSLDSADIQLNEADEGVTYEYRDMNRFPDAKKLPGMLVLCLSAPRLAFYNISWLRERLDWLINTNNYAVDNGLTLTGEPNTPQEDGGLLKEELEKIQFIVLDLSPLENMDATGILYMREVVSGLRQKHILLVYAAAKGAVREIMERGGLIPKSTKGAHANIEGVIYNTVDEAVHFCEDKKKQRALAKSASTSDNNNTLTVTVDSGSGPAPPAPPLITLDEETTEKPKIAEAMFSGFGENDMSLI
jgi:hypothetical protein